MAGQEPPMATIGIDTTHDGQPDTWITGADRNRDGVPDVMQASIGSASDYLSMLNPTQEGHVSLDAFTSAMRSGVVVPGPNNDSRPASREAGTTGGQGAAFPDDAQGVAAPEDTQGVAADEEQPKEETWKPSVRKKLEETEQRIAKARETYGKLAKEGEMLRRENIELKQVVTKARQNAERRILKKRAENVQLLADNAELETCTVEARKLAKQKAEMQMAQVSDEALKQSNDNIRRRLEKVLTRPERMPLGGSMDSPRTNVSSVEATPRINAVQEWRHTANKS